MDNIGLIIAIVWTGIAIVGVVMAIMFWVREEANSLRADAKEDRKDVLNMIRAIEYEVRDFHNRLCIIEERRKNG